MRKRETKQTCISCLGTTCNILNVETFTPIWQTPAVKELDNSVLCRY